MPLEETLTLQQMKAMQERLQERYKEKWEPIEPKTARNKMLWMQAEIGEAAQIIKKRGDEAIMQDAQTREDFIEEMCDVLMYWNDILLCYGIPPEQVAAVYKKKHERNMNRW